MLMMALLLLMQDRTSSLPAPDDATGTQVKQNAPTNGNEIVVQGRRDPDQYRYKVLDDKRFAPVKGQGRIKLPGDASASLDSEQRVLGGVSGMVRLRIPFGGKKRTDRPEE